MKSFLEALKQAGNPVRVWLTGAVRTVKIESVTDDRVTFVESGGAKYTTHPSNVIVELS